MSFLAWFFLSLSGLAFMIGLAWLYHKFLEWLFTPEERQHMNKILDEARGK